MTIRRTIWGVLALVYGVFFLWYTNLSGPFGQEEIDQLIATLTEGGASLEQTASMRKFMEEDDGDDFIMVNLIDMADNDVQVGEEVLPSDEAMARYMEHMWPNLLKRGCHPVFAGRVVMPNMDQVGLEGADNWENFAMMRYRSRRDLLSIALNPAFQDRHEFKLAALERTIAFPVSTDLYFSDPRFLLALLFVAIGGLIPRRRS